LFKFGGRIDSVEVGYSWADSEGKHRRLRPDALSKPFPHARNLVRVWPKSPSYWIRGRRLFTNQRLRGWLKFRKCSTRTDAGILFSKADSD